MNHYQHLIAKLMRAEGIVVTADLAPRHVEAWIRVTTPTLDALSLADLQHEVRDAVACALAEPAATSEALARSLGL